MITEAQLRTLHAAALLLLFVILLCTNTKMESLYLKETREADVFFKMYV